MIENKRSKYIARLESRFNHENSKIKFKHDPNVKATDYH
jgi:hypothetical protein